MEKIYRVLIVEDIPTDAELNEREIQAGIDPMHLPSCRKRRGFPKGP